MTAHDVVAGMAHQRERDEATIACLSERVARLEAELARWRDGAQRTTHHSCSVCDEVAS